MDEYQMMRLCERFDSIMNSEEYRRERIATAVLAGLTASARFSGSKQENLARMAAIHADALITELDK